MYLHPRTMLDQIEDFCYKNHIENYDEFLKDSEQQAPHLFAYATGKKSDKKRKKNIEKAIRAAVSHVEQDDGYAILMDCGVPFLDGEPIGI